MIFFTAFTTASASISYFFISSAGVPDSPKGSRILAFHTGGLQGIKGANQFLKAKNRALVEFESSIF
jgi:hypothetical protein